MSNIRKRRISNKLYCEEVILNQPNSLFALSLATAFLNQVDLSVLYHCYSRLNHKEPIVCIFSKCVCLYPYCFDCIRTQDTNNYLFFCYDSLWKRRIVNCYPKELYTITHSNKTHEQRLNSVKRRLFE